MVEILKTKHNTILQAAVHAEVFNTFVTAVKTSGLTNLLNSAGPFTVFAPTDEAFHKLPSGTMERLAADKNCMAEVVKNHIVPGRIAVAQMTKEKRVKSSRGQPLTIDIHNGPKVGGVSIVKPDIQCGNGILHGIDEVLMPE